MLNLRQPKSFALFVRSAYGDLLMVAPLINFIKQQNIDHKVTLFVEDKKRWTDWMINHPVKYNEKIYHGQHYALGILQLLNPEIHNITESLYPKLRKYFDKNNSSNISILTSVSNNRKSCQLDNLTIANILNKVYEKYNIQVFISTFNKDLDRAEDLQKLLKPESNIKITPSIRLYLKLINSVDLCFFGEGGGAHMTAALEVSQVVLFGHTSVLTWGSLSNQAVVLSDKSNVNNIPVDKILSALEVRLNAIKLNKQLT